MMIAYVSYMVWIGSIEKPPAYPCHVNLREAALEFANAVCV